MIRSTKMLQLSLLLTAPLAMAANTSIAADVAKGIVFNDLNRNQIRDNNEPGVYGVSVSNGIDVVQTDRQGRYQLPITDETVIFITKPRGFDVPVNDVQIPQFYYIHYPQGTPKVANWLFPVIDPTGPLPASVDFPVFSDKYLDKVPRYLPREESQFVALAMADPQAGSFSQRLDPLIPDDYGNRQLSDLRDEFIQGLVGTDAKFVMVAGDIVNDDLDLYPRHNRIMAALGIPVWNAIGNHDMNIKSPNDKYSTQTYIRNFGPPYYSFDYGDVHFISMDNLHFKGNSDPFAEGTGSQQRFDSGLPDGGSTYRGEITKEQLTWLKNDLQFVPKNKLIVMYNHIPLKTLAISASNTIGAGNINTVNLKELVSVFKDYDNVYTFSGHDTSNAWTVFLGEEDGRSPAQPTITHKTLSEVRVSLPGPLNDRAVRVSHMQDGTPNGHYFFNFNRNKMTGRFEAADARINSPSSHPSDFDDFQMHISVGVSLDREAINDLSVACPAPDDAPVGLRNNIVVNAFDGTPMHKLWMSLDGGPYRQMEHMVRETDVTTLPDGVSRPKGTAWCRDPFMVRYNDRIEEFLADIDANLSAPEASRHRLSSPQPSGSLWTDTVPADLEPGVHVLKIRRKDEFGKVAEANKVFEVCEDDFDSIEKGQVELRDCVVLTAR